MENPSFYIVDVFAEQKYTGNQLAVIRGAGNLSDGEMQSIAAEMNYSETTFVLSDEKQNGGYDVRIFTPKEEVPFAGHPTLGTAYVIRHEILDEPVKRLMLNLKAGQIPVDLGDVSWMRQPSPTFGDTFTITRLSQVLNLEETDLDERHPIREVSTGLPCIVAPLKSLEALRRCRVNSDAYYGLISATHAKAILVFSPDPYDEADLSVRFFANYYDVPEDPATGSANGCLATYLVEHRYFDTDSIDIRVEQGYEIGRPSLLYLRAERREGEINVSVGGKVQMVARGELL
ncbi:MAG: PhzF family phenazine biosynthesis protein [Actinobacteria bacterium]|nr:PhzF family phenazine biosynthesis protein [Actinomycetota bacterium]